MTFPHTKLDGRSQPIWDDDGVSGQKERDAPVGGKIPAAPRPRQNSGRGRPSPEGRVYLNKTGRDKNTPMIGVKIGGERGGRSGAEGGKRRTVTRTQSSDQTRNV